VNPSISRNNFDLIRLFAASQVAILHVLFYLSWSSHTAPVIQLLELFPGVPVFFFISGFLISRSYENTGLITDYTRNRALRIFPALHVCVFLNLLLVWVTGYFATVDAGFWDVVLLYLGKTTIFQFYNPDFMRHFGDGVLNGSLWTICVELQFYLLTPIIYALVISERNRSSNIVLISLVVASIIFNRLLYAIQSEYDASDYWKLVRVSFLPWIYMYLVGILAQRNFQFLANYLRRHQLLLALPAYVLYSHFMRTHGFPMDNSMSPLLFFPLAAIVFIAAYSAPDLSRKVLHGQDISYGIYIYHVPVMNMFLYYHYKDKLLYTGITLLITLAVALASWFLIERQFLKRKHHATHPVTAMS
jgi:peptidoglycan/LPS O-acetylase OafA/YrhL